MTPKGFLSITLLRMNQNQPNPSSTNKKSVESLKNPIVLKMWRREGGKVEKVSQNGHF